MNTNKKATLHILCGKIASGKSTLSKQLVEDYNAILICEDIWLQRLYKTEIKDFQDYLKYAEKLKTVVKPHVQELLKNGISVVLDYPANVPNQRAWLKEIYEEIGGEHLLHFLNKSDDLCLKQLEKRNLEKPEGSTEISVEQFNYITSFFKAPESVEGFNVKIYK